MAQTLRFLCSLILMSACNCTCDYTVTGNDSRASENTRSNLLQLKSFNIGTPDNIIRLPFERDLEKPPSFTVVQNLSTRTSKRDKPKPLKLAKAISECLRKPAENPFSSRQFSKPYGRTPSPYPQTASPYPQAPPPYPQPVSPQPRTQLTSHPRRRGASNRLINALADELAEAGIGTSSRRKPNDDAVVPSIDPEDDDFRVP